MKTVSKIVLEFGRKGHPLGMSIYKEDVPSLVTQLRLRLGMSEAELDLTPASLMLLEDNLFEKTCRNVTASSSEEEIVQFVREVAAYVGEVLSIHAEGRWESLGTLFSTRIVFVGHIKLTKEGRRRIVPSVAFSLGNIGAAALDMALAGKKPLLYRDYLSAKRKVVKEEL